MCLKNDHIFQHNGFNNAHKKYLDTLLSIKWGYKKGIMEDDILNLPCFQYKVR